MKLYNSIILLLSISSFFTALLYTNPAAKSPVSIFLLRWLHYTVLCFMTLYPFLFSKRFDFYYIIIAFNVFISWKIFRGECILSYLEKKYMNSNYNLGDDPMRNPYVDIVAGNKKEHTWIVISILINVVFLWVIIRFSKKIITADIKYLLIGIAVVFVIYYSNYIVKRIKHLNMKSN